MKYTKYLAILLAVIALLFVIVVNFSSVTNKYECPGALSSSDGSKNPSTVYFVHEGYRWWVHLWSHSDGNIKLEIPNKTVEYYGHVVEVGTQIQIYDTPKDMKGNFSILSKTLAINTPFGFFDGKCEKIK